MNRTQFFEFAKSFYERAFQIMQNKNDDYSQKDDPYLNFKLIALMLDISPEEAMFSRMTDKYSRLKVCLKKGVSVKEETLEDTLIDIVNYSVLLAGYLKKKLDNAKNNA